MPQHYLFGRIHFLSRNHHQKGDIMDFSFFSQKIRTSAWKCPNHAHSRYLDSFGFVRIARVLSFTISSSMLKSTTFLILLLILFDIWRDNVIWSSIKSSHNLYKILRKHNNIFINIFMGGIGYLVSMTKNISFKRYSFTVILKFFINSYLKGEKWAKNSPIFIVETSCASLILLISFSSNIFSPRVTDFLSVS